MEDITLTAKIITLVIIGVIVWGIAVIEDVLSYKGRKKSRRLPMTLDKFDMEKLMGISPSLSTWLEVEDDVNSKMMSIKRARFIARDMLKLAEENERLEKKIAKMESIPVKVREISDLEFEPMPDEHEDITGELAARKGDENEKR